jgi:hypothetical protein
LRCRNAGCWFTTNRLVGWFASLPVINLTVPGASQIFEFCPKASRSSRLMDTTHRSQYMTVRPIFLHPPHDLNTSDAWNSNLPQNAHTQTPFSFCNCLVSFAMARIFSLLMPSLLSALAKSRASLESDLVDVLTLTTVSERP